MRLGDALAKFVVQLEADGRAVSTIEQYMRHIHLLERWLDAVRRNHDLQGLDHECLAAFLASEFARNGAGGG